MNETMYSFVNGRIITLDPHKPVAHSLTVSGGRILSIDSPPEGKTINLQGNVMFPGFADSHMHLTGLGRSLEELQLTGVRTVEEITAMVEGKTRELPKGKWIFGRGWDQTLWPGKEFPPSRILDEISPQHPVLLTRVDGHAVWVNKKARKLAGISKDTKIPEGGKVINDCIFIDRAMELIQDHLPKKMRKDIKRWIRSALTVLAERGITSIHDAWAEDLTVKTIRRLIEEEEFPIRYYGMLASDDTDLLKRFFSRGPLITGKLIIRSVKAFMDGALGSRGAALLEPYSDDPKNSGLLLMPEEQLISLARKCRKFGFQLNTHAIGDRANRIVLDAYASVLKKDKSCRWRIEHAQMVAEEDMPRFSEYGVIPSVQPSHCTSDMRWLENRLGRERMSRISRWAAFARQGVPVPGGSDCPIEAGIPVWEYYAAVTRQDHNGEPAGGWYPEERLSRMDALKMFTSWAAYASFEEHLRGTIRQGFDADFTVLSKDITQVPAKEILETKVMMTVVEGEVVYRDPALG